MWQGKGEENISSRKQYKNLCIRKLFLEKDFAAIYARSYKKVISIKVKIEIMYFFTF